MCIATGKTRSDVETQIREAMEFHIEGLRQHGEPVPEPTIETGKVFLAI
jgi:predicted RNase H-like HicB family nuclease